MNFTLFLILVRSYSSSSCKQTSFVHKLVLFLRLHSSIFACRIFEPRISWEGTQLATMKDLSKLQLVFDGGEPECNPKQHKRSNAIVKPVCKRAIFWWWYRLNNELESNENGIIIYPYIYPTYILCNIVVIYNTSQAIKNIKKLDSSWKITTCILLPFIQIAFQMTNLLAVARQTTTKSQKA